MKRKYKDLTKGEIIETLDALYTAAGTVKGRGAMKLFFRDLLTPSERIMLGRRILIAQQLLMDTTRDEIMETMKVGPDTIWRVQRWLEDALPGYEDAIREMEKAQANRRKPKYPKSGTFAYLKKKYPLHFLLWPGK